jgi:1-acyl-sn-glycerol-3-phosphate acyltransferase
MMDILKSAIVWFAAITFVALLFPFCFLVWLLVLPFDRKRTVIHWLLIWQSKVLVSIIPFWRLTIEGKNRINRKATYVIISNHQSLADILILNCHGMRYKWISKAENMKLPVLGWYLRMAGYITVNRSDDESKAEMLAKSYNCLKKGTSIMIFPEGTRSRNGEIGFFKRGAFQLALETGMPILPVVLDGTGEILAKNSYVMRGFRKVKMKVLDPVYPESFGTTDVERLADDFRKKLSLELIKLKSE